MKWVDLHQRKGKKLTTYLNWQHNIRFANIIEWSDLGPLLQKETRPGGLFAPVTEATRAVDEIRFSAERTMYLVSRMQVLLSMQGEIVYHDLANQPGVRQLL